MCVKKHQIAIVFTVGMLAGCSGLSQIQEPVTQLDQGVHSVSTNEMTFLKAVETADCNNQFYNTVHDWAVGKKGSNFDITGDCTPSILTDKQIQIRQQLMDALTLYADKMRALTSGDDDKTLDANSQQLASSLNSFAKKQGFSSLAVASDVEAAIINLSEMVLDQKRFADIHAAASSMQPSLKTIIDVLKTDNTNFALGLASNLDQTEVNLRDVLINTHRQRGAMSFFDVVEARQTMQTLNPLGASPLAAPLSSAHDPSKVAEQLNASLDAIVVANQAIANGKAEKAMAAVNDLVARAKSAQSDVSTLNK